MSRLHRYGDQTENRQTQPSHPHKHAHSFTPISHLSRTPGRVRSADHLRPSLQQADCLCHWRQPVTQRSECEAVETHTASGRENCALCIRTGCVGVLSFSICHFHSLLILHTHSRTGSGAERIPSSREDRAVREVARFNHSWLSQICGTAVVEKLIRKFAGDGHCYFFSLTILTCFLSFFLSFWKRFFNIYKEMDLR